MWQGVDKRRFPRANYPCKIIIMKKGETEKISTHTENIGVGGVCVIVNKDLDRFSEVELILILDDSYPPIDCEARIIWTVKRFTPDKQMVSKIDTGIEFINLKEEDRIRIEKIVKKTLQKQNRQEQGPDIIDDKYSDNRW